MDIKKSLSKDQTLLLLMPGIQYNDEILDIVKQLSDESICYVTINKTFDALMENFKKNKINTENLVFIDAISKTIKATPDQASQCYFVESPAALTELSLVISKFLRHEFKYLIFDSLTNLLIYQSKAPVAKFLSSLVNKIRQSKTKAVFYALSLKEQEDLIKQCGMFVDNVVDSQQK
jgi:archaellum biogenesis ATPase FlaH